MIIHSDIIFVMLKAYIIIEIFIIDYKTFDLISQVFCLEKNYTNYQKRSNTLIFSCKDGYVDFYKLSKSTYRVWNQDKCYESFHSVELENILITLITSSRHMSHPLNLLFLWFQCVAMLTLFLFSVSFIPELPNFWCKSSWVKNVWFYDISKISWKSKK